MHLVVQAGDGLSQGLDAGGGAVLAAGSADVEGRGAVEAALDVILNLGGALCLPGSALHEDSQFTRDRHEAHTAEVGPLVLLLKEAKLSGALGAPHHARRRSGGVEAGMGEMAVEGMVSQR